MNNITYRIADIKDLNLLIDLRIEFLQEINREENAPAVEELKKGLTGYFTNAIKNNTYISIIAEENGTVAGTGGMVIRSRPGGFLNPYGTEGYLLNMFTLPSHRKKGICSKIFELLIEEGKRKGITSFELHATKDGERLYQKNGFKIHAEPTYRRRLE